MNEYDATEVAFKNGYKKAAEEIFEEIENLLNRYYNDAGYTVPDMGYDIDELKKKHTEGKT